MLPEWNLVPSELRSARADVVESFILHRTRSLPDWILGNSKPIFTIEEVEFIIKNVQRAGTHSLVRHSIDRPPYSISVFNLPMLVNIEKWIVSEFMPLLPYWIRVAKVYVDPMNFTSAYSKCLSCGMNRVRMAASQVGDVHTCTLCGWSVLFPVNSAI